MRKAVMASLCLLAGAGAARADKPTIKAADELDVTDLRDKMVVMHDGRGHYLAATKYGDIYRTFYGDGKVFWQLRVRGGGSNQGEDTGDRSFWAANTVKFWGDLSFAGNQWKVQCDDRETPLVVLGEQETRGVLDNAVFKKSFWKRQAHALGRDSNGYYFYVDRLRPEDPMNTADAPQGYRLFIGRKGRLKWQRLRDSDTDSKGFVLQTRRGALAIDLEAKTATWSRGRKKTTLTFLPIEDNTLLVYRDFSLYGKLGTPCDSM
ncbi:MAG TPA: hypothetical protein VMZ28_24955 [Kofleriaceae bacterium]|nr:hypothetical protein [Kofleriaceae bacterium]